MHAAPLFGGQLTITAVRMPSMRMPIEPNMAVSLPSRVNLLESLLSVLEAFSGLAFYDDPVAVACRFRQDVAGMFSMFCWETRGYFQHGPADTRGRGRHAH